MIVLTKLNQVVLPCDLSSDCWLKVVSSEGSTGLDIEDDPLLWVTVDVGC